MKSYRELPAELFTKDGATVFINGYIQNAKEERENEIHKAFAEKILNRAIKDASEYTNIKFVANRIALASKIMGTPNHARTTGGDVKSINGVPQFEFKDTDVPPVNLIHYEDANQQLREHFAERVCVNCIHDADPEVGCCILNAARNGDDFHRVFRIDVKNFSCAAWDRK